MDLPSLVVIEILVCACDKGWPSYDYKLVILSILFCSFV